MNLKITFLKFMLLSSATSIAQEDINIPVWLNNKIEAYQKSHPHINATKTEFNNRVAYYIPPRCCDMPSELYDENGKLICYPNGGFAGGDGKCPTFVIGKKEESKTNGKATNN
jgi:hypothetical protein